jgi:hypothetical protein
VSAPPRRPSARPELGSVRSKAARFAAEAAKSAATAPCSRKLEPPRTRSSRPRTPAHQPAAESPSSVSVAAAPTAVPAWKLELQRARAKNGSEPVQRPHRLSGVKAVPWQAELARARRGSVRSAAKVFAPPAASKENVSTNATTAAVTVAAAEATNAATTTTKCPAFVAVAPIVQSAGNPAEVSSSKPPVPKNKPAVKVAQRRSGLQQWTLQKQSSRENIQVLAAADTVGQPVAKAVSRPSSPTKRIRRPSTTASKAAGASVAAAASVTSPLLLVTKRRSTYSLAVTRRSVSNSTLRGYGDADEQAATVPAWKRAALAARRKNRARSGMSAR